MPSEKRERKRQNAQLRHQERARVRRRSEVRRRVVTAVVVVALFAGVVALITAVRSDDDADEVATTDTTEATDGATTTTVEPVEPVCPPADGSATPARAFTGPFEMCIDPAKSYKATIETDVGTIEVALDAAKAPKTVNNFVSLARYHYFDGLTFHRVVPDFVLQGGDPEGTGRGGPGYSFEDELPQAGAYEIGSLAMANSGPDTNGSQFFIISGPNGVSLPPNYSLFGKVTAGMDVVEKIEADGAPDPNPPKVVHRMVKVTIEET